MESYRNTCRGTAVVETWKCTGLPMNPPFEPSVATQCNLENRPCKAGPFQMNGHLQVENVCTFK